MGNSLKTNARCYILDNYNKKHIFDIEMTEVHNNDAFIFFKTKPFYSNEIQLFIYKKPEKNTNNPIEYLVNLEINLEEEMLIYNKLGNNEFYEYSETFNDNIKVSIRLTMEYKISLVVFKLLSKNLYKIK
jgi:hypothetical protein